MMTDFFKVGDNVNIPGLKNPITIIAVGAATAHGRGQRGRKFLFAQNVNSGNIYCHFSGRYELIKLERTEQ